MDSVSLAVGIALGVGMVAMLCRARLGAIRRQAHQAAQGEARRWREMVERLPVGVLHRSRGGAIYANTTASILHGVRSSGLIGGLHAGDHGWRYRVPGANGLRGEEIPIPAGAVEARLVEVVGGDGVVRPATLAACADGDGTTWTLSPIAEEASASGQELAFQARLALLLSTIDEAVITTDPLLKVESLNPAAVRLCGLTAERARGRELPAVLDLRLAGERAGVDLLMERLLMVGTSNQDEAFALVIASSREAKEVDVRCAVFPGERGQIGGMVIILRDRSRERHLEEQVKASVQERREAVEANQAKTRFLARMSHELRTPLNAILGFSRLLAEEDDLADRHRERLGIIQSNGNHLQELIDDVLEISKVEAGEDELRTETFDLHRMLDDLIATFRSRVQGKHITVHLERAPTVPSAAVQDARKLRQVLYNLVGNAVKFTRLGSVTLRAVGSQDEQGRPTLELAVIDTGPGIESESLDHLFEPFYQSASGRDSGQGTGLGLTICQRLVELMGGRITVESEVGVGTTVHCRLPIGLPSADQLAEQATGPGTAVQVAGGTRPRILVVDDNEANRMVMEEILSDAGFLVETAADGAEAVARVAQGRPDLVFMDMRMPRMDGREATRRIKLADEAPIVVALTASAFEEERRDILAAGCDDFLRKPFRNREVFAVIDRHLEVAFKPRRRSTTAPRQAPETADAPAALPDELLQACREAAVNLDQAALESLLQRVAALDPARALHWQAAIAGFDFGQILTDLDDLDAATAAGARS